MWDKLTYTKKCRFVFLGFILFLFLAYKFSFSETFYLRSEIKEKETKISWLKQKEKELPMIKSKLELIETAYRSGDSIPVRDKLTAFISDFSENNNCIVTEIPVSRTFKNDNVFVETNSFTVKGRFKDLLELENAVENTFKVKARIMSLRYFSIKDPQKKTKNLYLTIITQSFNQPANSKHI